MLLKGEGEEADNMVGGPEWSTLVQRRFSGLARIRFHAVQPALRQKLEE